MGAESVVSVAISIQSLSKKRINLEIVVILKIFWNKKCHESTGDYLLAQQSNNYSWSYKTDVILTLKYLQSGNGIENISFARVVVQQVKLFQNHFISSHDWGLFAKISQHISIHWFESIVVLELKIWTRLHCFRRNFTKEYHNCDRSQ